MMPQSLTSQGVEARGVVLLRDSLHVSCSLLTLGCWLLLLNWYSLVDHYATPGFAFDKIPGHFQSTTLRYTALLLCTLMLLYGLNYWLIRSAPSVSKAIKLSTIVMIGGAGTINVLLYPITAIDVFYYLAELKLAYGYRQNPYLVSFVPSFAADPIARFGWPLHVPLAYGPAWLLIGRLPTALTGFDDLLGLLLGYKTFSFLLLLLGGLLVYHYHADERSRWLGAYAFLANPLVLFEAVGNAHNDLVMTVFLIAAMLAIKRRSVLALPLLALSALVKVFTLVTIPFFLLALWTRKWNWSKILCSALLALAAVVGVLAPFWANGKMLGGMLQGMAFANNLKTASVLSFTGTLLQQYGAPERVLSSVRWVFGGLFVVAAALIMWRSRNFERVPVYVLLLFYTLAGSIQPWYWIPVIALLALKHGRIGFAYLVLASALALLIPLVDVWARFNSGWTFPQRHLLGTLLLNVPALGLLWIELRSPIPREHDAPLTL